MTASLRKMRAGRKLMPLDRIIICDADGLVLLDEDCMDLRNRLVMATFEALAVTLETLCRHGHLLPVDGRPFSYTATESGQIAAWLASDRLTRRRSYGDEDQ